MTRSPLCCRQGPQVPLSFCADREICPQLCAEVEIGNTWEAPETAPKRRTVAHRRLWQGMKLILSRKGFDSSAGGKPSPIFPDGTMISLPRSEERRVGNEGRSR